MLFFFNYLITKLYIDLTNLIYIDTINKKIIVPKKILILKKSYCCKCNMFLFLPPFYTLNYTIGFFSSFSVSLFVSQELAKAKKEWSRLSPNVLSLWTALPVFVSCNEVCRGKNPPTYLWRCMVMLIIWKQCCHIDPRKWTSQLRRFYIKFTMIYLRWFIYEIMAFVSFYNLLRAHSLMHRNIRLILIYLLIVTSLIELDFELVRSII